MALCDGENVTLTMESNYSWDFAAEKNQKGLADDWHQEEDFFMALTREEFEALVKWKPPWKDNQP